MHRQVTCNHEFGRPTRLIIAKIHTKKVQLDTAVDNSCNTETARKVFVQEVLEYWLCDLACFTFLVFLYVWSIQLLTTL